MKLLAIILLAIFPNMLLGEINLLFNFDSKGRIMRIGVGSGLRYIYYKKCKFTLKDGKVNALYNEGNYVTRDGALVSLDSLEESYKRNEKVNIILVKNGLTVEINGKISGASKGFLLLADARILTMDDNQAKTKELKKVLLNYERIIKQDAQRNK